MKFIHFLKRISSAIKTIYEILKGIKDILTIFSQLD